MENKNDNVEPILGFDEIFENGIIVDGTDVDLTEVNNIMREYLQI